MPAQTATFVFCPMHTCAPCVLTGSEIHACAPCARVHAACLQAAKCMLTPHAHLHTLPARMHPCLRPMRMCTHSLPASSIPSTGATKQMVLPLRLTSLQRVSYNKLHAHVYTLSARRQQTVNWCNQTDGTAFAFDFTAKGILQQASCAC
eukprot:1147814-Pelagomonas_calceolata.AAC.4